METYKSMAKISLATEFFGTLREVERTVNGRIDKMRKNDMGGMFLSAVNIQALHLVLEFSHLSSPLKIAEEGQMVKGAFVRALKSLSENGLVTLTDNKVSLTTDGKKAAKICSEALESAAQELIQTDAAKMFAKMVTKRGNV